MDEQKKNSTRKINAKQMNTKKAVTVDFRFAELMVYSFRREGLDVSLN